MTSLEDLQLKFREVTVERLKPGRNIFFICKNRNKCQDICVKNLTFVYLQKNSFNYENS